MPAVTEDSPITLFGYHGFRNAGAEARLLTLKTRLVEHYGRHAVRVVSLHPRNLSYISDVETVYVNPAFGRRKLRRLSGHSSAIVFTEGNMLSDAFTAHMVETHMSVAKSAFAHGTHTAAVGIDSAPISRKRSPHVMDIVNRLDLLTLRTPAAVADLKAKGMQRTPEVTADCAVSMPLPPAAMQRMIGRRLGLEGGRLYGVSPVDFHMYPARIRPAGRPSGYVKYPFAGTWPDGGARRTRLLLDQWEEYSCTITAQDDSSRVAVVVMDPSDRLIATRLHARLIDRLGAERVLLVDCLRLSPTQMSSALSHLRSITTSRYHALVMPMAYSIPFVAFGHDNRLRSVCSEVGMERFFVDAGSETPVADMVTAHERLDADYDSVAHHIGLSFQRFQERDEKNYSALIGALS